MKNSCQKGKNRSVLGTGVCFTKIVLWIALGQSQENVQVDLGQNLKLRSQVVEHFYIILSSVSPQSFSSS